MEKIEYVDISKVKPYEKNPREITKEAVEAVSASIREFGFKQPIVVDKDMVIIVGHTRLKAAKKLGMKEVPVMIASDLTPEQVKAYRLADNRTNEFSLWDEKLLSAELNDLLALDFDMEQFGFELPGEEEKEPEAQEDGFEPELPEEPYVQLGDIYQLGRHRLICGDITDPEVVKALMDGETADMIATDPPYNVDYTGGTKDALKIKNDNLDDTSFRELLVDSFTNMAGVLKLGGAFYVWHASRVQKVFEESLNKAGLQVR